MPSIRLAMTSAIIAAAATLFPTTAAAQDVGPLAEPSGIKAFTNPLGRWSDDRFRELAEPLLGTWKSTAPIPGESGASDVYLTFHHVHVDGMTDVLYSEAYRADQRSTPYRQAFMQFYSYKGTPRVRTLEFRLPNYRSFNVGVPEDPKGVFVGLGHAPEAFPKVSADQLIGTLDMTITQGRNGFSASTPYPYPTNLAGATEMTSSMELNGDQLRIADRGFAPDGSIAWGTAEGGSFTFARSEPNIRVDRRENGLIVLWMNESDSPETLEEVGRIFVHYTGWLVNGRIFDTSRQSGRQEFALAFPRAQVIRGWADGLRGVSTGDSLRLIIPSDLGYGPQGQPAAGIPSFAPLYFTIDVRKVQPATPVSPTPAGADR